MNELKPEIIESPTLEIASRLLELHNELSDLYDSVDKKLAPVQMPEKSSQTAPSVEPPSLPPLFEGLWRQIHATLVCVHSVRDQIDRVSL